MRRAYISACISLLLAIAQIFTDFSVLPIQVEAASNRSASSCEEMMCVGINGTISVDEYMIKRSGASYTFTSTKPSVAKVNSKGTITGVKIGKASITVIEKYKGKRSEVGSVKVAVKRADMPGSVKYKMESVKGYYTNKNIQIDFKSQVYYINPKAAYTIVSSDPSRISIDSDGIIKDANGEYGDVVKLIVKETYKSKTRTIGTVEASFYTVSKYQYKDDDDDF